MAGYDSATTDAWDVIKRREERDRLATREALRVGGSQPFQTTRKTGQAIEQLSDQQDMLEGVVAALAQTVGSIPISEKVAHSTSGWGPSGGWATVATVSIATPAGKSTYKAHAVGAVNADFSSGTGFPQGFIRVLINGEAGMTMGARGTYADTGSGLGGSASGVAQHVREQGGFVGSVTAEVQFYISWLPGGGTSATWACAAQIALDVSFTT